jgi:hypothetical protein
VAIDGYYFAPKDLAARFLDPETGRVVRPGLPEGEMFDQVSCSPWVDDRGRWQAVGRWSSGSGEAEDRALHEVGLARFTFPGGEALDRIPTEIVPAGPPCWFPGTEARVLFAAGDGQLYRVDFEGDGDGPRRSRRREPQPLDWDVEPPGGGPVFMAGPAWPTDGRLGGRVLVSLMTTERVDGRARYSGSRLWWLQLDADGSAIKAAGRLTVPDPSQPDAPEDDERGPTPVAMADGSLALAYLCRPAGRLSWQLRLAPIEVDPQTGAPSVRADLGRTLADDCLPIAPVAEADGRHLVCIRRAGAMEPCIHRLALDGPRESTRHDDALADAEGPPRL